MKRFLCAFICMGIFYAQSAVAAEKMTVAVMKMRGAKVSGFVLTGVSNIIQNEFNNIANFTVVERSQIDRVMREHELRMTGIMNIDDAARMGKFLSAKKIIIGEVDKLGKGLAVSIRIVDVDTAVSEYSARKNIKDMDDLEDSVRDLARSLARKIIEKNKEFFYPISPLGYYARCAVPGWGQVYADHPLKGYIIMGVFTASVGFSIYAYVDFKDKQDAYDGLQRGSNDFDSKYDAYDKAANMFNYSLIAVGAVYLLHWVDALFLSKPDFKGMKEEVTKGASLEFNIYNRYSSGRHEKYALLGARYNF